MGKLDRVGGALRDVTLDVLGVVTAVLLGSATLSPPAFAQSSTPSVGPTQAAGQCPVTETPDPAMLNELRELALKPGVKIEPSTFMKDPRVAEFVVDMTRQEQVRKQTDWSGLCRYRAANASQQSKGAPQVVFLGDSITENWIFADPALFTDKVVDRGISGQTSSQILLRFYPDVVALRPRVVHIMAGTNDILQNTGPVGADDIVNNISAMLDIAQVNHIKVVLASILPISVRSWQPDLKPAQRLIQLNARLKALAAARGVFFIDYFTALKDSADGLNADLGNDGVHPNRAGYALMKPMATRAIEQASH
jgi:lysophospholipase L1-like esterase